MSTGAFTDACSCGAPRRAGSPQRRLSAGRRAPAIIVMSSLPYLILSHGRASEGLLPTGIPELETGCDGGVHGRTEHGRENKITPAIPATATSAQKFPNNSTRSRRQTQVLQTFVDVGQVSVKLVQLCADLDQHGPIWARFAHFYRTLGNFRPALADSAPSLVSFSQILAHFGESRLFANSL